MTVAWGAQAPLVLASASMTRRAMLEKAGLVFEAKPAAVDERAIELELGQAAPQRVASALARAKAREVAVRCPGRIVLGADQTLNLDGRLLHKPVGRQEAAAQLAAMAGRHHRLHSAFALIRDEDVLAEGVDTAALTMRALSSAAIETYLDRAGPAALASVGAYQLEGLGAHLFAAVEGDYFTILGLPLLAVLAALREHRLLAF